MVCCGQSREALRSGSASPRTTPATRPAPPSRPPAAPASRPVAPPPASRPIAPPPTGQPVASPAASRPVAPGPPGSGVALRYLEQSRILVRGPASGRQYEFSARQPVQQVDGRDAPALLGTRFFRRAP